VLTEDEHGHEKQGGRMGLNIYVASSWRNAVQPMVVKALREHGFDVYDFRDPDSHFKWADIDPNWVGWGRSEYIEALEHPLAHRGFESDMAALERCDVCLLVLPCGRSAHIEAGWAVGAGKPVIILLDKEPEPELMYKMTHAVVSDIDAVVSKLEGLDEA
jgi:nucleoside 2-deoxyribosyltransferase